MDLKKDAKKQDNKMRAIYVDKLILHLCTGESGDKLTKAAKVLEDLTDQKPVQSKAKYSIRTFGIKRNENIAVHATVRGDRAMELLKRSLKVKEYELRKKNFSQNGNFGFGIDEHIDLGIKYDTSTGIFGMDFTIVLKRAGNRVANRRCKKTRVGKFQRVHMDDAKLWFIEELGGTILN